MKSISFRKMASLWGLIILFNTGWVTHSYGQWTWLSFFDITYQVSPSDSVSPELKNGGFALGQYDLFTSYNVNENLFALVELVFESPGAELVVDLERLLLNYTFADWLSIEAGRGHTPLGYYSNTFHHGRQLESAIGRPLILEFEDEGGLVPAHIVGVWAKGFFSGTSVTLDYTLGVLNGQKIDVDNGELSLNLVADDNTNKALVGKLNIELSEPGGIGFGGSFYKTKINGYSSAGVTEATDTSFQPALRVDQTILGAHVYYDNLPVQVFGEYYAFRHKNLLSDSTGTFNTTGFFVQGAYEIQEKFRPYLRVEVITPDAGDPYTATLFGTQKVTRYTFGVRYNISPDSSVKLEAISHKVGNASAITVVGAQWSVVF